MSDTGIKVTEILIAYFSANQDDTLTAVDVCTKFGVPHRSAVWRAGMQLQRRGLVEVSRGEHGMRGQEPHLYAAGPVLLKLIGRAA